MRPRFILERLYNLFFEIKNEWEIGIIPKNLENIIFKAEKIKEIKWFKSPNYEFWADPFGLKLGNLYYIFYEAFNKKKRYGRINCMILDINLKIIENRTIIDEGLHMSFPQVFHYNSKYFILPETLSKNKLSLYVCEFFPWKWVKKVDLLDEQCYDSLLFQYNQYWYLFYSKVAKKPNLYLKRNKHLTKGWKYCQDYLISNSSKESRNAGQIFQFDSKLYRPSQDCSRVYGEKIRINQINEIIPENYSEIFIRELKSEFFKDRDNKHHTINKCGDITLIDRNRKKIFAKSIITILKQISSKIQNYNHKFSG